MLGLKLSLNTTPRSLRGVARLGMFCGAFAALTLQTGCVPPTGPCLGVSCDDEDACTTDTCTAVDGEPVCANDPIECPDQVCNPADGACVDCVDDADCDDGLFCNGDETCDANACVDGDVPCAAGETCNEATDACDTLCTADDDCADDAVFCNGTESCDTDTGVCVSSGDPCGDDGTFCNGTESCDEAAGACVSSGDPCVDPQVCSEVEGACTDAIACTEDADCTNTDFCDGTESCDLTDPDNGVCASTGDPCAEGETCNEDTDTCVNENPSEEFRLTSGTDTFTGGAGDDFFDGQREITGGTEFVTLNNADSLSGGAGTDTLSAQLRGGATVTPSALTSIEVLTVEVSTNNAETLNAVNADSLTTINNNSPSNSLTVTNVQTAVSAIGVSNSAQNLTITSANTALAGTADAATLTVSSTTAGTVTVGPTSGTNGYESISVSSGGGAANTLTDLVDTGTTTTTLNLMGSQDLTITNPVDAEITTINGGSASGKLVIDATAATGNVTFTGGTGDDSFDISGTYSTSDTIDGGDGTDTLILTANEMDTPTVTQTNVSNIETLKTDTITSGSINIKWFGATNLFLNTGAATGDTFTLPTGGTLTVDTVNPAGSNTIAVEADTTADVLNLVLDGITWTTNVTASTFETVNIASNTAANSIGGTLALTATAQTDTINVTGSAAMTFTGQVTADVLNASTATGVITTTGGFADDVVITGGTGNDSLRGSSAADIISGGDGNDTIRGDAGADTLTGGAGNDTFNGDNGDTDETVTDTITDFDAGTSTTTNDVFVYDISSIEAVTGVTDLTDTNANSTAAADGTLVVLSSDGATVSNADVVAIIGDYANAAAALAAKTSWTIVYGAASADNDAFLVAYTSGTSVRIAVAVNAGVAANSDAVDTLFDIAILQSTTLSTLDSGDFTAQ